MESRDCISPSGGATYTLVRAAPVLTRLDVGPWLLVHAVLLFLWASGRSEGPYSFVHALACFFAVLGHSLTALAQHWSIAAWRNIAFSEVSTLAGATHVYVRAPAGALGRPPGAKGTSAVVPLERVAAAPAPPPVTAAVASLTGSVTSSLLSLPTFRFSWQSLAYELRTEGAARTWSSTPVAAALPAALSLGAYADWAAAGRGWSSEDASMRASSRFGPNVLPVPIPSFWALFLEHATAPFFVFQVACVGLWCLDSYLMYSLFTLFTLVAMEATLVGQRIATARQLRGMRPPPHLVFVLRSGKWKAMPSQGLVPMDIVSIAREAASDEAGGGRGASEAGGAPCPADVLLLAGSVVTNEAMLTGESTPQMKEAPPGLSGYSEVGGAGGPNLDVFEEGSDRSHARHVVFAGTSVIAASEPREGEVTGVPAAPDSGAVALVLRTGPHTSQGELLRSIMHSTERVSVADREAFVFIGAMLVFAVVAAWYVLTAGLADPRRDRWKLGLHVIMILTTVVPPELPVELSMAVNISLTSLMRRGIFCTEPARIPTAGKVDIVAFDKTGTLTADSFRVQGVVLLSPSKEGGAEGKGEVALLAPDQLPPASRLVLLGCHALVAVRTRVPAPPPPRVAPGQPTPTPKAPTWRIEYAGDPIEEAALEACGWAVDEAGIARPKRRDSTGLGLWGKEAESTAVRVVHRWPFSSVLKRMTCAVSLSGSALTELNQAAPLPEGASGVVARAASNRLGLSFAASQGLLLVTKGAPEVLEPLLAVVPPGYTVAHSRLAASGARVLALAFRVLPPGTTAAAVRGMLREAAEAPHSLTFAGFLSASSPLKTDSVRVVRELQGAGMRVLMITGDAPLTALAVARQLGIKGLSPAAMVGAGTGSAASGVLDTDGASPEAPLTLTLSDGEGAAMPVTSLVAVFSPAVLRPSALLAVTGRALDAVGRRWPPADWASLCTHASVFARVSPAQKERIVGSINDAGGHYTAMVGDGSNDTGALKRAHLGLAVISNPALEASYDRGRVQRAAARRNAKPGAPGAGEEEDEGEVEALLKTEHERTAALLASYGGGAEEGEEPAATLTSTIMAAAVRSAGAGAGGGDGSKKAELQALQARMASLEAEANADGGGMSGPPVVALGDASMAAPLTSKLPTPAAILDVLRQGRCTLVTTHQMFKILGVNSLVAAYMLSVLHLANVKLGDTQATTVAMAAASCFMLLSFAKPIKRLSPTRPHTSVFHAGLIISVLGQFAVHTGALMTASALVGHNPWIVVAPQPEEMVGYVDPATLPPIVATVAAVVGEGLDLNLGATATAALGAGGDLLTSKLFGGATPTPAPSSSSWLWGEEEVASPSKFVPSTVNTAVFLVYAASQACTFLVSYSGPPFMEPLRQQTSLLRVCLALYAMCIVGAMGWVPEMNAWFQLLPLEGSAKVQLAALILADAAACFAVEAFARAVDGVCSRGRTATVHE
jgi:cation-transporting ATPase 13A1